MESVPLGVRKGSWTQEEDTLLGECIEKYGVGRWHQVPLRAGLNRCRKSCRLRWLNYLQPNIKRGDFAPDEDDLIIRLHKLLGNRWSLIARRIPGRTANDVKNYWKTHLARKIATTADESKYCAPEISVSKIVKPKPFSFSKKSSLLRQNATRPIEMFEKPPSSSAPSPSSNNDVMQWWESLYANANEIGNGKSWSSLSVFDEEGNVNVMFGSKNTWSTN